MQLSDEQIWDRCLNNDNKAFKEIYCRYYPLLYNYGSKFITDKELVKDCIQDLFIKLIQNHKKLSPTLCVKGYLLKAFRNKLYDSLEKEKSTDDIELYQDSFFTDDMLPTLFGDEPDSNSRSKRLMQAYRLLSSHQQEILYLYYVNELKHEEIASVMEINYQSSKNLLFRSLSNLRKLYFTENELQEK